MGRDQTVIHAPVNRTRGGAREIDRSGPPSKLGAANVNDARRDDTRHPTSDDVTSTASSSARQIAGPNGERKASEVADRHRVTYPSRPHSWLLVAASQRAHLFLDGAPVAACGVRRPAVAVSPGSARTCGTCLDSAVTA